MLPRVQSTELYNNKDIITAHLISHTTVLQRPCKAKICARRASSLGLRDLLTCLPHIHLRVRCMYSTSPILYSQPFAGWERPSRITHFRFHVLRHFPTPCRACQTRFLLQDAIAKQHPNEHPPSPPSPQGSSQSRSGLSHMLE